MSVWDDNFEDDIDKNDFEAWLDHINESGDPEMDEECYNEVQAQEWEKWMDSKADEEAELMDGAEYPEWMVKGKDYIMTVSNN